MIKPILVLLVIIFSFYFHLMVIEIKKDLIILLFILYLYHGKFTLNYAVEEALAISDYLNMLTKIWHYQNHLNIFNL